MVPLRATDARELTLVVATLVVVVVVVIIIIIFALCIAKELESLACVYVCVGVGVYASECSCASNELKLIQSVPFVRPCVVSSRVRVKSVAPRACVARCVCGAAGGRGVSEGYHRRVIIRKKTYQWVIDGSQFVDK